MRVGTRLFAGVVPSIVGLFSVAALAYWGEYSRSAPEAVVIAAAIASIVSLITAWRSTRYVARRVERLAEMRSYGSDVDELDAIETRVGHLGNEVTSARADARQAGEVASRRTVEYARLASESASVVSSKLEDARMSLHVLQENHFGVLNDNQEELIGVARAAVDDAETELAKLRMVARVDQGQVEQTTSLVRLSDILRSLLPVVRSRARSRGLRVIDEIDPVVPQVRGDRARLRDAIALVLNDAVAYAIPGSSISVHLASDSGGAKLIVNHGASHTFTSDLTLAQRLVSVEGGNINAEHGATIVLLRS